MRIHDSNTENTNKVQLIKLNISNHKVNRRIFELDPI